MAGEGGGEHRGPFCALMCLKRQVRSAYERKARSELTSCKFVMYIVVFENVCFSSKRAELHREHWIHRQTWFRLADGGFGGKQGESLLKG